MTSLEIGGALFLDGIRALPVRVELAVESGPGGEVLALRRPEGTLRWPMSLLREVPDQADRTRLLLASADDDLARLVVSDEAAIRLIRQRAPFLGRSRPVGGFGKLVLWAAAAVASVALIVFVLVPVMADQLAEYLPPGGEKALGDATLGQVRSALSRTDAPVSFCEGERGMAALRTMYDRLAGDVALPYPVDLYVLDADVINAFALPGGHMVFFRGLIDAAGRPEEVGAVFAHELGHVVNRDPTRSALRSAGSIGVLGLLLGDFAGGTAVLYLAERLIDAQYSQGAEAGADRFALRILPAAGVRPDALATLFERIREKYGDDTGILRHFESHPALGDRIEAARKAAETFAGDERPLLSEDEWQALRSVCGKPASGEP